MCYTVRKISPSPAFYGTRGWRGFWDSFLWSLNFSGCFYFVVILGFCSLGSKSQREYRPFLYTHPTYTHNTHRKKEGREGEREGRREGKKEMK